MTFKEVYKHLESGAKIKRLPWHGYWQKVENRIEMHCKNGEIISLLDTDDIFWDFKEITRDEWCVATLENCEVLRKEERKRYLLDTYK